MCGCGRYPGGSIFKCTAHKSPRVFYFLCILVICPLFCPFTLQHLRAREGEKEKRKRYLSNGSRWGWYYHGLSPFQRAQGNEGYPRSSGWVMKSTSAVCCGGGWWRRWLPAMMTCPHNTCPFFRHWAQHFTPRGRILLSLSVTCRLPTARCSKCFRPGEGGCWWARLELST